MISDSGLNRLYKTQMFDLYIFINSLFFDLKVADKISGSADRHG